MPMPTLMPMPTEIEKITYFRLKKMIFFSDKEIADADAAQIEK